LAPSIGRWHDYAWCWVDPHLVSPFYTRIQGSEVVAIPTPGTFIALVQNKQKTTGKSHPQL